jgi:tetratricopeptide (TPR) repeat protein
MVAKAMIDKQFFFLSHCVLGCLYLHLGLLKDARTVFDLLKDVAEDSHNWGQAMQAYEWIGRVLQHSCDYENAIKSFKKMMQLSWVNNIPEFEVKSFHNIGKQYFYLQYIEKCTFYQERFLRGMLENPLSCQRTIAE